MRLLVTLVLLAATIASGVEAAPASPAPRRRKPQVTPRPAPSPNPLAVKLCDALHVVPQERRIACCAGGNLAGHVGTPCVAAVSAALQRGAVSLDPAAVDRCAADMAAALQGCDWVTPLAPRAPDSCTRLLVGQRAAGAACNSPLDCVDGLHCRTTGGPAGVCVAPAAAGARCGGGPDPLGSYAGQVNFEQRHPECDGFCKLGRCEAWVSAGGACLSDVQCGTDLHCASGKCMPGGQPKLGEGCAGATCAEGICLAGVCTALKKTGAACTSPFECEAACVKAQGEATGVCGKQCHNWPPPGYTLPVLPPSPPSTPAAPQPAASPSAPRR